MPKFTEFLVPSAISNRKAAAGAVAAGFFVAAVLAFLTGVSAAILLIRDGRTSTALWCACFTVGMTLVAIGTWKRIWLAPLLGLIIGLVIVTWASRFGKLSAIILVVPIVAGFWTAMRGITFLKRPIDPPPTSINEQ
jgi:hypothetical protein